MAGFLYCISHSDGLYKVGMTPDEQFIKDVQKAYQLSIENNFINSKIEFSKKVLNAEDKEEKLHKKLKKYEDDVFKGYYRIELNEIKELFDFFDGDYFNNNDDEPVKNNCKDNTAKKYTPPKQLKDYFNHGQKIRYLNKKTKETWICSYDSIKDGLIRIENEQEIIFKSLSEFVKRYDVNYGGNPWYLCQTETKPDVWVGYSTFKLRN